MPRGQYPGCDTIVSQNVTIDRRGGQSAQGILQFSQLRESTIALIKTSIQKTGISIAIDMKDKSTLLSVLILIRFLFGSPE